MFGRLCGVTDYEKAKSIATELEPMIAEVLGRHEVSMINKWLAVIETVNADGERGLWMLTPMGMTAWDSKGLLAHAMDIETASTINEGRHDED